MAKFVHNHRPAAHSASIHDFRRFVSQRLMRTLAVVEGEILGQADRQFAHCGIAIQIHILVLDASPETLDEDVVKGTAPPIHADDDILAFQGTREGLAGELGALIAIEQLWLAIGAQGTLQAVYAEDRFQAVADAPAEDSAGIPVDAATR